MCSLCNFGPNSRQTNIYACQTQAAPRCRNSRSGTQSSRRVGKARYFNYRRLEVVSSNVLPRVERFRPAFIAPFVPQNCS